MDINGNSSCFFLMRVCGLVVFEQFKVFNSVHVHASCCDLADFTLYFQDRGMSFQC